MIDLRGQGSADGDGWVQLGSLDDGSTTGRTPVADGLFGEYSSTLIANSFHSSEITGTSCRVPALCRCFRVLCIAVRSAKPCVAVLEHKAYAAVS